VKVAFSFNVRRYSLDSAVISSIIKPMLEETKQEYITFTVGQEGSPDITAGAYTRPLLGSIGAF
jgi:asparagine synthase (glutamine-hydrolysing)